MSLISYRSSPILVLLHSVLLTSSLGRVAQRDVTHVSCTTTQGTVEIDVHHLWAPLGAAHFVDLVERSFYTDVAIFRRNDWIAQLGAQPYSDPRYGALQRSTLRDDPKTNCPQDIAPHRLPPRCVEGRLWNGALAYAGGGIHSRGSQWFFVHNIADQPIGGEVWEVPFAELSDAKSLETVRRFYSAGDAGVALQSDIMDAKPTESTRDVLRAYPNMDYVLSCEVVVKGGRRGGGSAPVVAGRAAAEGAVGGATKLRGAGAAILPFTTRTAAERVERVRSTILALSIVCIGGAAVLGLFLNCVLTKTRSE